MHQRIVGCQFGCRAQMLHRRRAAPRSALDSADELPRLSLFVMGGVLWEEAVVATSERSSASSRTSATSRVPGSGKVAGSEGTMRQEARADGSACAEQRTRKSASTVQAIACDAETTRRPTPAPQPRPLTGSRPGHPPRAAPDRSRCPAGWSVSGRVPLGVPDRLEPQAPGEPPPREPLSGRSARQSALGPARR